jgi:uncharacterized membrane protein YqaE (UPF0057 family)
MSKKETYSDTIFRQKKLEKLKKKAKDSRSGYISGRGPVGKVVAKLIDVLLDAVKMIFKFFWFTITLPTFNFVWDVLFSEFHGVFAGKEKDGECYNSSILRYIITILMPPMGVFMAKGLSGWPSIGISIILTFFHMFPGIIYAFVVTYDSRYADRYQKKELEHIEKLKKLRQVDPESAKYQLGPIIAGCCVLVLLVYGFIRLGNMMA